MRSAVEGHERVKKYEDMYEDSKGESQCGSGGRERQQIRTKYSHENIRRPICMFSKSTMSIILKILGRCNAFTLERGFRILTCKQKEEKGRQNSSFFPSHTLIHVC